MLTAAARLLGAAALVTWLVGCGGSDFGGAPGTDLDGGVDQAAPPPESGPQGTGGAPSAGGGPTVATGGAVGQGTGGVTEGGPPGAGGANVVPADASPDAYASVCPVPVINDTSLPTSFTWDSYFSKYGDDCMRCTASPCGEVDLGWFPVLQDGLTVTATINYSKPTYVSISMGHCGQEIACAQAWQPAARGEVVLHLVRSGAGYAVESVEGGEGLTGKFIGTCPNPLYGNLVGSLSPDAEITADLRAALLALTFPCGAP